MYVPFSAIIQFFLCTPKCPGSYSWGYAYPRLGITALLGHSSPHSSSFQLAQTSFEVNLHLYKYHSNLLPIILLVHTTYEDGTE
jgi:hypothetical protein